MTKFANGIDRMDAFQAFVDKHKIEARAVRLNSGRYLMTLFMGNRHMEMPYGMGSTATEAPRAQNVLDELTREGREFLTGRTDALMERDGLSADDAKVAAFAALKGTSRLARFLGESAYDELYGIE